MQDVVWFSEVDKNDTNLVGGKGANLGELYKIGIPIPNGFIICASSYLENLKASGALDRIKAILYDINVQNPTILESKAQACQAEIKRIKIHPKLLKTIEKFYQKLSNGKNIHVAVRSSATAEDLQEASFAGQQATFLNVRGLNNLTEAVLGVWASLFEARAIFYRVQMGFDHFKVAIAVPVQKMVQSEVSGVMFTVDPVTSDKNKIVIEAIFGLGELIVGGQLTPDHYEVNKKNFRILQKNIAIQTEQLVKSKDANKLVTIARSYQNVQKLDDKKIIELAKIGFRIEQHYYFPQDIEWALENQQLYIVQTRPVTTFKEQKLQQKETEVKSEENLEVILQGAPASPKIASGKVVIIKSPRELIKVQSGAILVAEITNPDYVPAMRRAAGIITDRGGRTSHAAIVSRELGIACVVGTGQATKKLKDNMYVTVDGLRGIVFKGQITPPKKDLLPKEKREVYPATKTATKLYVNLAEPELAAQVASQNVDGVGLLRAEFILAQIGTHPKMFIKENRKDEFLKKLSSNLSTFGKAFGSRPVIYRATDLKTSEYRNLKGGEKYEPKEPNPMLGFRGAFRYIKDPDVFKLELEALSLARQKHQNIHLMIPFVRNVKELQFIRSVLKDLGFFKDKTFKFWMMAEIPTNVILLEDYIKVGLDGVSIGSNDLTMLILGTDRDNEEVASEFNELDPAVLWALERVIKTCHKYQLTSSICGQAPSIYPELTQKLVSWGISSISVNPDKIEATRRLIYEAEHKLISKINGQN